MKKSLLLMLFAFALFAKDYPIEEICFGRYIAQELSTTEPKHVNSYPTQKLPPLQIYISASVPKEVWWRLADEIKLHGGAFILRGPIKNSLYETEKLKIALNVPILIGNAPYEKYAVQRVPTCIYDNGKRIWQETGTDIDIDRLMGEVQCAR